MRCGQRITGCNGTPWVISVPEHRSSTLDAKQKTGKRDAPPGLANCSFRTSIAISQKEQENFTEVWIFAISRDQRASALSYPANPDQWPFKVKSSR
jgi:hypothetical protein